MAPFPLMAFLHLGLEEAAEGAIYGPPGAISLNDAAFDYCVTLEHPVDVDPDAFSEDFHGNFVCIFVSLLF